MEDSLLARSDSDEIDEETGYSRPVRQNTVDLEDSCCGVKVTNRTVLWVSSVTFTLFVTAEVVGALASNSLSLLGDAAAMSVDVFTYFCNLYAEHVKEKKGKLDESTRMLLEVYVPSFSVTALIAVSIYILWEAIQVIISPPEEDDVNVYIMYGFAAANMLVDLLSMFLFWFLGKKVLFQKNIHTFSTDENAPRHIEFLKSESDREQRLKSMGRESQKNLNMISALTHVSGDTLRTIAIFFSALVATLTDIKGAVTDSWAAVIVTATIFAIVIPLIKEIYLAILRHYDEVAINHFMMKRNQALHSYNASSS